MDWTCLAESVATSRASEYPLQETITTGERGVK